MYTYVQRPMCKKENTATYVHTGESRTPTRVRTARARVHGWVGTEKQRRRHVHGEATECVVFIGRQRNACEPTGWVGTECVVVFIGRAWTEHAMETRPGIPHNRGNGLVFDRPCSKWSPADREGPGVPQNGGNGPPTVEMGVLLIGRGVAYRKTEEMDLLRSKRGSC